MAVYYFDTSALVKYYIPEDGSHWVIATIDASDDSRNQIIVATVAFAEMCATFGRLIRDGYIRQETRLSVRLISTPGYYLAACYTCGPASQ